MLNAVRNPSSKVIVHEGGPKNETISGTTYPSIWNYSQWDDMTNRHNRVGFVHQGKIGNFLYGDAHVGSLKRPADMNDFDWLAFQFKK